MHCISVNVKRHGYNPLAPPLPPLILRMRSRRSRRNKFVIIRLLKEHCSVADAGTCRLFKFASEINLPRLNVPLKGSFVRIALILKRQAAIFRPTVDQDVGWEATRILLVSSSWHLCWRMEGRKSGCQFSPGIPCRRTAHRQSSLTFSLPKVSYSTMPIKRIRVRNISIL
jgi:hypothetical protein